MVNDSTDNLTKYERQQQAKAEKTQTEKGARRKRKLWRLGLWFAALVLVVVTVWQVDRAVSGGKKLPLSATSTAQILTIRTGDWLEGEATAPAALIEYSDFQCPACAEYNKITDQLKTDFGPKQLAVVYRHYPWFFHPQAMSAALASEAAGKQGKFWAMHDLLFAKQDEWSVTIGPDIFTTYARQLGLEMATFNKDLTDSALRQKIEGQLAEGKNLGIDYTPAFALNGQLIANPQNYQQFKQVITDALKK